MVQLDELGSRQVVESVMPMFCAHERELSSFLGGLDGIQLQQLRLEDFRNLFLTLAQKESILR
jgi:hypothetical protein